MGQLGPYMARKMALLSLQVAQNRLTCASHGSQDGPFRPLSGTKSAQNMISTQVVQPKLLQHWQLIASRKACPHADSGAAKMGLSLTSNEMFECSLVRAELDTKRREQSRCLQRGATLWFPPLCPMLHPRGPGNFYWLKLLMVRGARHCVLSM